VPCGPLDIQVLRPDVVYHSYHGDWSMAAACASTGNDEDADRDRYVASSDIGLLIAPIWTFLRIPFHISYGNVSLSLELS